MSWHSSHYTNFFVTHSGYNSSDGPLAQLNVTIKVYRFRGELGESILTIVVVVGCCKNVVRGKDGDFVDLGKLGSNWNDSKHLRSCNPGCDEFELRECG